MTTRYDAVMLIAFGGPERMEDVRPFLDNVLAGRPVPQERYEEVVHHYELLGGRSPLNELTRRQASALQSRLRDAELPLPVHVGMRNWKPYLKDTLSQLYADGARRVLGMIMAAQQTEASVGRYKANVDRALHELDATSLHVDYAPGFHAARGFVEANACHIARALAQVPQPERANTELVFTAHSIPAPMARQSPYEAQLQEAAEAVAGAVGHGSYRIAYQSRSGKPEDPWLEPDINDVLVRLAADGTHHVVISPMGFVCDHVEVLYDLDVEAAQTAERVGLSIHRAAAANAHTAFIGALAELVLDAVGS